MRAASITRLQTDHRYRPRVVVLTAAGEALWHLPGEAAQVLVEAGTCRAIPTGGRIKAVELAAPASTHAVRIGAASPPSVGGTKFYRWTRLTTSRIVEHHPRALIRHY
jgi:hypothetical protein